MSLWSVGVYSFSYRTKIKPTAMKEENNGWIKLHRAYKTNPINKNSQVTHLWINLLCDAHWNNNDKTIFFNVGTGIRPYTVKRGQLLIKKGIYAEQLGMSRPTFNKWLSYLESEDMIHIKTSSTLTLITIVKYQQYQ